MVIWSKTPEMYFLTFYFEQILFQVSWGWDFLCMDLHFQLYYTVCITLRHCGLQLACSGSLSMLMRFLEKQNIYVNVLSSDSFKKQFWHYAVKYLSGDVRHIHISVNHQLHFQN